MKNIQGRGRTAGTRLDAAGASLARAASGVWLRAVSRLGLVCRGTVYLLASSLALRLALAAHEGTAAPASTAGSQAARNKEFCTQRELCLLRQIIISMDLYLPRDRADIR